MGGSWTAGRHGMVWFGCSRAAGLARRRCALALDIQQPRIPTHACSCLLHNTQERRGAGLRCGAYHADMNCSAVALTTYAAKLWSTVAGAARRGPALRRLPRRHGAGAAGAGALPVERRAAASHNRNDCIWHGWVQCRHGRTCLHFATFQPRSRSVGGWAAVAQSRCCNLCRMPT